MHSLRALTWLLVVLVLVPAGVLAWVGFQAADAYDAAVESQIRRELGEAEAQARQVAAGVLAEAARELDLALARLADEVRRRLPTATPHEVLDRLRGRCLWLTGARDSKVRPLIATVVGVRLLDAQGRPLHPAAYVPVDGRCEIDTPLGLLDHLRREADRRLFGDGDEDAVIAVWTNARDRMPSDVLRATCDVESALIRCRAGGDDRSTAKGVVAEVERVWSPDLLWRVGRPAVRLWLRAARECPAPYSRRFYDALFDGRLARVPLTEAERRWIRTFARSHHESTTRGSAPALGPPFFLLYDPAGWNPPNLLREVPVAHDARLEVWVAGASFWAHIRDRVRDLGTWGPVDVALQGADSTVSSSRRHVSGVEVTRALVVPGPDGLDAWIRLTHREARDLLRRRDVRRLVTSIGVVSLLLLMLVGLVLVRRAVGRERAARRLRDDFIANVSHELRTPLASVCMHAEMLADEDPPPERRRDLARVVRAEGGRLAALVDDLLDFAALERGTRRIEPEPVDLARAVREAARPYGTLAEREGVTLEVDVPQGELPALADTNALARILANLLSNAWRHGRPSRDGGPGRIRVLAYDDVERGEGPTVQVRDDGPGIPAEERRAVFERFRRGRHAGRVEGTGLGLALGRELARAMEGDLEIVDDAHETVLCLTLPPAPEVDP